MTRRSGLTLLEVLVALVVLGFGAASWAALAGQEMRALDIASHRERETARASGVLADMSTWSPDRLASRGGVSHERGFNLVVTSYVDRVYDVSLADSTGRIVLQTAIYAPHP